MEATKIEVIYSFKISEQKITRLEFTYQPSEAEFLYRALSLLKQSDQAELIKISACQLVKDSSQALSWILKSNGKYLFRC